MNPHPNGLRYGTVRRALAGFAHAILLDQHDNPETWLIVDLYGNMTWADGLLTDEEVADWPIVYEPMDDGIWALMVLDPVRKSEGSPDT